MLVTCFKKYHDFIVQVDYFQDDIFPDTKVTWEPALSAESWFSGKSTLSLIPFTNLLVQFCYVYVLRSSNFSCLEFWFIFDIISYL